MKREVVKAYALALSRFLLLWLGAVLLGLGILLLRGFTMRDVGGFILAHKRFAAVFTAVPFMFMALFLFEGFTQWRRRER